MPQCRNKSSTDEIFAKKFFVRLPWLNYFVLLQFKKVDKLFATFFKAVKGQNNDTELVFIFFLSIV
jgi:hypothetical protein